MRECVRTAKCVAALLVFLTPWAAIRGQSVHPIASSDPPTCWDAASGDWSQDANWSGGEPTADLDAYVGSTAGPTSAGVTITQAGEACRVLHLGKGDDAQGSLTIEPGGTLTAAGVVVGHNGTGTVVQKGGACTVVFLDVGYGDDPDLTGLPMSNGYYELLDGTVTAEAITITRLDAMFGRFTQHAGRVETNYLEVGGANPGEYLMKGGTLINTGWLIMQDMSSHFEQWGGSHRTVRIELLFAPYVKHGGDLVVTDGFSVLDGSVFRQDDGNTHVQGDVSVRKMATFALRGGSVRVDGNLLVAQENSPSPELELLSTDGALTVGGTLTLRGEVNVQCALGAQIRLTAPGFVNEMPETAGAAGGLANLTLVFEAGADRVATCEAAGEDRGPDPNGFLDNHAIGTLCIGGEEDVGRVLLVDDFENAAGDALPEAVYVEHLVVQPGCTLDLNGLNLYYLTGGADPGATVVFSGGSLTRVPEPATFALLALGGLAVLRRRQSGAEPPGAG